MTHAYRRYRPHARMWMKTKGKQITFEQIYIDININNCYLGLGSETNSVKCVEYN